MRHPGLPVGETKGGQNTLALLCLLAGGCAIAFSPVFVRVSDTGPLASAFYRVALAAPWFWLWLWRAPGEPTTPTRISPWALAGVGLCFAADLGVWHWSILWTSVANATLLANLAPIFVTLGGWLFFRKRITGTFMLGMLTALAGMLLLLGEDFSLRNSHLRGDALGALTAVWYAGYLLLIKGLRDAGVSTARLMAWSSTLAALVLLPVALLSPQPMLPANALGWLPLLGLACVSQLLGQSLITYALAHVSAPLSSVSLLTQPLIAALLAWTLFGEALNTLQLLGGGVVLGGIWVARRGG